MSEREAAAAGTAVLVIDDSPEDRAIVRELLGGQYRVLEAAGGEEGLAAFRRERPACILLDYRLPGLDGLQVLCAIVAESGENAAAVVMLTGSADTGVAVQAMKAGAQDYLDKDNLSAETLRHALHNALAKADLQRRVAASQAMLAERNRALEDALRRVQESEARYRALFEGAGVALWEEDFTQVAQAIEALRRQGVTDMRTYCAAHPEFVEQAIARVRIVDVNQSALRLLGAADKEEMLASLDRVFLPETRAAFVEELAALAEGRGLMPAETALRTLRGERIDVLFSLRFPQSDEPYRCTTVSVMDIGEQKRARDALAEADRRKDEFLAMLAHELRNPLAPIRNALQIMRTFGAQDRSMERAREMIGRQAEQLTRLVDDLLDVSRITQRKVVLKDELIELKSIVDAAIETARPRIDERRHRLTLTLPAAPLWLRGDAVRLAQALSNLLINAAKYIDHDEGSIALVVQPGIGEVELLVRDDGIGIAPELLPQMFELFTQADRSLDRSQGGLGVGSRW